MIFNEMGSVSMANGHFKMNRRFAWTWMNPCECLDTIESLLNQKISIGWKPVRVSGRNKKFIFESCEPGAYVCKTAITINKFGFFNKSKSREMEQFFAFSGGEIVEQSWSWSRRVGVISVHKASIGTFKKTTHDIDSQFSDYEVRKKILTTIARFRSLLIALLFLCQSFLFFFRGFFETAFGIEKRELQFLYGLLLFISISVMVGSSLVFSGIEIDRYEKTLQRFKEQRHIKSP